MADVCTHPTADPITLDEMAKPLFWVCRDCQGRLDKAPPEPEGDVISITLPGSVSKSEKFKSAFKRKR